VPLSFSASSSEQWWLHLFLSLLILSSTTQQGLTKSVKAYLILPETLTMERTLMGAKSNGPMPGNSLL
jgi:hypothetical protein